MPGISEQAVVKIADEEKAANEEKTWRGKKSPVNLLNPSYAAEQAGAKAGKESEEPKAKTDPAAADPWTQLAQSLVGQLQQEQAPVEAAISGALTQPAAATALGIADQAVGISPSSSTGEWLQQQVSKGATEMDPLQQALSAYGSAYGASQVGVDQALVNMGKANDAAVNSSEEQPFLSAIASHIGGGSYYDIPQTIVNGLPGSVQEALYNAGWGGITPPKGGWGPGSLPSANNSVATALTGLTPSSTTGQTVGTTTGNASQPGS